ncbi:MAG: tyrosine-type recombinase/integrase [Bryobacterales bacterium]|nr:tyrosine-type recombinase/integrase [Bryobacterales bacterium]
MRKEPLLGPWVRRYLAEHLVTERNLARNTQLSYRDTLALLLPFVSDVAHRAVDRLLVTDVSAERVRLFLQHLEQDRGCSTATRNQRLAAIRAFAGFVALRSPEHVEWCGQVRSLPLKKVTTTPVCYLEQPEIDALLAAPDPLTARGRRERLLLKFLYNTGARATEASQVRVSSLMPEAGSGDRLVVRLEGKGRKTRLCPLWQSTSRELAEAVRGRPPDAHVFLNRCGRPLTRYGIYALVVRCAKAAARQQPSLASKKVTPHSVRHTTATHLLRAGVDINTIRVWLGHASLATTNIYAEIDLAAKARAIDKCDVGKADEGERGGAWKDDQELMAFLGSL